jgi:tRNA A37 threonylcarbamoyladenosine dehydratase
MNDRIMSFAPDCRVTVVDDFVTPENVAQVIPADATFVIDAIDQVRAKAALVASCVARGVPVYVCGGAGGKSDTAQLSTGDLALTEHDALLSKLRSILRRDFSFPRGEKKFGVTAIFSREAQPREVNDGSAGLACAGYGSVMHMTASIGLLAAGCAIGDRVRRSG